MRVVARLLRPQLTLEEMEFEVEAFGLKVFLGVGFSGLYQASAGVCEQISGTCTFESECLWLRAKGPMRVQDCFRVGILKLSCRVHKPPQKVYTFAFIVGNIIPKYVKCIHSATKYVGIPLCAF